MSHGKECVQIISIAPAPPGMRAVYGIYDEEGSETRIVPVLCLAHVLLQGRRSDVGGVTVNPAGCGLIMCPMSPYFAFYLSPGESTDDVDERVRQFVEHERKGICGHCGRSHRRRRRGGVSLVCWSGGCDSTLVLVQLAEQSSAAKPVKALSFVHPQVGAEGEQRKARKAILDWCRSKGYHVVHQEVVLSHKEGYDVTSKDIPADQRMFSVVRSADIIHPVIWLLAAQYLDVEEDLYFGYVRSDDLWHARGWFVGAFEHLKAIMGKKGNLRFPLEYETKADVLKELKRLGVLDLCWTCEEPQEGKACGKCKPCQARQTALWQIRTFEPEFWRQHFEPASA